MTWNGLPVDSDTVWSTTSGSMCWKRRGGTADSAGPMVGDGRAHSDRGDGSSRVSLGWRWSNGLLQIRERSRSTGRFPADGWWALETLDSLSLVWMHSVGCQLDSVVSVEIPEVVNIQWALLTRPVRVKQERLKPSSWEVRRVVRRLDGVGSQCPVGGHPSGGVCRCAGCLCWIPSPSASPIPRSGHQPVLFRPVGYRASDPLCQGEPPLLRRLVRRARRRHLAHSGIPRMACGRRSGVHWLGTVDVPSNPLQSVETMARSLDASGMKVESGWSAEASLASTRSFMTSRSALFRGNVLESGRIPCRVDGVVLVRFTDRLGRSSVWVR